MNVLGTILELAAFAAECALVWRAINRPRTSELARIQAYRTRIVRDLRGVTLLRRNAR